jgi:hypothetical protein
VKFEYYPPLSGIGAVGGRDDVTVDVGFAYGVIGSW